MRTGWRPGVKLTFWLILLQIAVYFPGRLPLAHHEEQYGKSAWEVLLTSLTLDVRYGLPFFALTLGLVLLAAALSRRITSGQKAIQKLISILVMAYVVVTSVTLTFCNIGASEFKLQRGIYPVVEDLTTGLSDQGFVGASIGVFVMDRYFLAILASIAAQFWIFWRIRPYLFSQWRRRQWPAGVSYFLTVALVSLIAGNFYIYSEFFLSTIRDNQKYESPLRVFADSVRQQRGTKDTLKFYYMETPWDPKLANVGARMLGYPEESAKNLFEQESRPACDKHPLRFPLTDQDNPLTQTFTALSKKLFAKGTQNLQVVQFIVESYRADDIAEINPLADPAITPFTNAVIQRAKKADGTALAATAMHEGGVRTSQGISAIFCGMGGMPLQASLTRDFGRLGMRCLSDVLSDAGFSPQVFYGAGYLFDNMETFFEFHDFELYDWLDFPENSPTGVWGKSDLALWQLAWEKIQETVTANPQKPNYAVLLTLSNHFPFRPPEDTPQLIIDRIEAWHRSYVAKGNDPLVKDDLNRLITTAYSDEMLRRAYETISASSIAEHTIIVISADHSSADKSVWLDSHGKPHPHWQKSVPAMILFPPALVNRLNSDPTWRHSIAAAQKELSHPTSLNDLPRLLLALLSEYTALKNISEDWKWHSLAGQASTNHYQSDSFPDAKVWGIDSQSQLFMIDKNNNTLPFEEKVEFLQSKNDPQWHERLMYPVAVYLGSFMRGFNSNCSHAAAIRQQDARIGARR